MWFKNLQLLRLTSFQYDHESLLAKLEENRLKPLGKMELMTSGWVPPRDGGELAEKVGNTYVLALGTESKILPDSAIKHVLKSRVVELTEQQGFPPGRKQTKLLKETVTDELMPAALIIPKRVQIMIDPMSGWIMIDTGSVAACDNVIRFLIRALALPIDSLFTKHRPASMMTQWMDDDYLPPDFTVDSDVVLTSGNKGVVRLKNIDMRVAQDRVKEGAIVTQMAMTYESKISFMLAENATIKRLQPLDVIKESAAALGDQHERYVAEMMLCIDTLKQLISALVGRELGIAERGEGQAQGELKVAA